MTTIDTLDLPLQDSQISVSARLGKTHLAKGTLPIPTKIRENLAPGRIVVTLFDSFANSRRIGAYETQVAGSVLVGVTWPAEIVVGTPVVVTVARSGGTTRRVDVCIDIAALAPAKPVRAARKPRAAIAAAPVAPAEPGSEVVSREIVAASLVHGGTRVIELTITRHTDGRQSWATYRIAAYDSNHRAAHHSMGVGPANTPAEVEDAYAAARGQLTPSEDPAYCDCWSGWDPECGKTGCWGIHTRR